MNENLAPDIAGREQPQCARPTACISTKPANFEAEASQ